VLLFGTILCGGFEPSYLRFLFGHRTAALPEPDRRTAEYPRFLEGVAARTSPGQSIVVIAPMRYWRSGYGYAYYRASYFLAGRRAIPILDDDDGVRRERLQQADFIAVWRMEELPGYEVVWRGHGGALMRRAR
jgi:hypothetical protein